jgi:ATP-binding cassette subfamily A (ABC1) protein 3
MTIQIPTNCAPKFGKFFLDLDKDLRYLRIQSYGISIATLEEVFLRMGHLEDPTLPIEPAIKPDIDYEKQK